MLGTNRLNHEIVPVSFPQRLLRLLRQKDLSSASDRANPDRVMHVETDVPPIKKRGRTRMYAHSHLEPQCMGPRLLGKVVLGVNGSKNRRHRLSEDGEELISATIDYVAVLASNRSTQELPVLRQD